MMHRALVMESTEQYDELMAMQNAEPGTDRELTADELAVVSEILDAEDGYVVLRATADNDDCETVWYLSDDEAPTADGVDDSHERICWPAGETYPRRADEDPREPQAMAIAQADVDWPVRHEDLRDAEEAADLAVSELLDDPAGWPRFVPDHWKPGAWVDCYRTAYAAEWEVRNA